MADEYSQPPYNRTVGIPAEFNWPSLKARASALEQNK
jgi:type I restriction enzyme M protein